MAYSPVRQQKIPEPRLLILDEPEEGIQPNIVARKYADRFAVLDRGRRVVEDEIAGLTDELIKKHLTVRLVKAKKLRKNA